MTHGIYSAGLSEEEKALWKDIPLGTIDDELRIARLQLVRAKKAQKKIDDAGALDESTGFELSEIEEKTGENSFGPVDEKKVTRKRPDYQTAIDRILGRIGKLELIRATIGGAGDGSGNIAEMFKAIEESEDDLGEVREEIARVPENAD